MPLEFYYRYAVKHITASGELVTGMDVNVDRVSVAVVDRYGRLKDVKTFWFEEASRKPMRRKKARGIIGMRVNEMLRCLASNGVGTIVLENPDVLGKLKLLWVRRGDRKNGNYNYRVSVFRCSIIEMIAMKAPLYGLKVTYVSPRGTTSSLQHEETMRRYGLDRHTASAYPIAVKHLRGERA